MSEVGPLALVGGGEWHTGCDYDAELLAASGGDRVSVLPTAAAYEHPQRSVDRASAWFQDLGATVTEVPVLTRRDAESAALVDAVRQARFLYIADGSPMHLRSVMKDSLVWQALVAAWQNGAVIAGSAAGATVLGDPMVDPRGGAFTLGLGLVRRLAVVPHWERWTGERARRMTHLMPADVVIAEVEERTALIRWPDGHWTTTGSGAVVLRRNGAELAPEEIENLVDH